MAPSDTRAGRTTPRTKPAPQRRRELLDAGLEVFADKGVAAATVDQITRAAGVAKGTFYLHFETKEHLLAALQKDFEARLVERADAAARGAGDDPVARLTAWVDDLLAHYPQEVALHDVLFHHPVVSRPGADDPPQRELTDSLADVITEGRSAGAFDVDDVELTSMLLCSALHRLFDRIWHRHGSFGPDRMRAVTLEVFLRAVGAPAHAPARTAPTPTGAASSSE